MLDEGNGKKVAVHTAEILALTEAVKAQTELLDKVFGPGGICSQKHDAINEAAANREKKIALVVSQTKWQWATISGLGVWVGYITRLFVEHFQRG